MMHLKQPMDPERWIAFANQFSREHDGWAASLEVREAGSPLRTEVGDSLFRGLTFEERDGHNTLVFTFGDEPEEHFAHIVHEPLAMASVETNDHAGASLVVDTAALGRCILALWNPMREEERTYAHSGRNDR